MKTEWIFRGTVIISLLAHGVLLAFNTGEDDNLFERIIRIPVMIEAEPPPPEPVPPPEPKKEPKKKLERPRKLAKQVRKVVEGDGLRSGDLVDAEVGEYEEEALPAPMPPPEPPPKIKQKLKPNKVKLARDYLSKLRGKLALNNRYPLAAQRMGLSGSVTVSFIVGPNSVFSGIKIKRSSGHNVLDGAAIATVSKLSGRLQRPKELGANNLKTSVVLRYTFQG